MSAIKRTEPRIDTNIDESGVGSGSFVSLVFIGGLKHERLRRILSGAMRARYLKG